MANGQQMNSSQGTLLKTSLVTIALVGIAVTASAGTLVASGGTGVLSLSGSAMTASAGSLTRSTTPDALAGQRITSGQGVLLPSQQHGVAMTAFSGTATPNLTLPLTGQSITSAQYFLIAAKTVAPDVTVGPLFGYAITSATGSMQVPRSLALTGTAITSGIGTAIPGIIPFYVGLQITSASGFVTVSGPGPVTVGLSGLMMTMSQGNVDIRNRLTGIAITSAAGTATLTTSLPLTGLVITSTAGMLTANIQSDDTVIQSAIGSVTIANTLPLTGTAMTASQGSVHVTADATFALTGQAVTVTAGSIASLTVAPKLVGQPMAGAQGMLGAPLIRALTGQAATFQTGNVALNTDKTLALVGQAMTLAVGTLTVRNFVTPPGQMLTFAQGHFNPVGGNMSQALVGQAAIFIQGTMGTTGGDSVDTEGTMNEGCGITQGPMIEGCGITSETQEETLVLATTSGEV